MEGRAKRPRLSGSSDDRDALRKLLHTGAVSMRGLKKIMGMLNASGLSIEEQHFGRHQLLEANNERLPM
jgi:hypothetical protein